MLHTGAPDFLRLMKKVVAAYPGEKVHVVLDNASVHLSDDTEEWLAKQGGKVAFHFTPTRASWMNQIEIWNGVIACKLIRCGTFRSVKALDREIEAFVKHWNSDCKPFKWTATAEEIMDKLRVITARMDALLRATEIDDVARQAA
jgi:hypothetical protein